MDEFLNRKREVNMQIKQSRVDANMTRYMKMITKLCVIWMLCMVLPALTFAIDYKHTEKLLSTENTIIGEPIYYPGGGRADVQSLIVVMNPGEKTVWHKHGVPLFAYILSGDLRVNYGDKGERTYHAGDAFMEAMDQFHQGQNIGKEPVRILAVFMGGNNQKLVIKKVKSD